MSPLRRDSRTARRPGERTGINRFAPPGKANWREVLVPLKGAAWELGYRLRPARRAFGRGAKAVVRAAFVPIVLVVKLFARMADGLGRLTARIAALRVPIRARFDWLTRVVRPEHVVAIVTAAAAIALAAAQFFDYHGVGVGKPDYQGEIGTVAPAPETDRASAGSAHLYLLVPVALAALALTVATARGRWRLGRGVALLGLVGIAVSLIVDAPKGLDAGIPGIAYYGADAQLLEGFWAQLASSAALVWLGLLLSAYVRDARAAPESAEPRRRYFARDLSESGPSPPAAPRGAGA